ncbi:hypothetical protein BCV71DRAFT_261078 [Rhizopus microsporus]|uniref:Tc1-like transposase DDE domain-containing protein n=1 Tax=Rhizopus microsporus TaxID=58291 RepID=A0A1X0SBE7_RHIZD|nr:hypothetical protein BCV71DRAFT_261078 [Rhizopus microsporus]
MDEMDCYPHMKGHYLVMDNAPIHTSEDIAKYVESRGYHCIYLPSYFPELNPIDVTDDDGHEEIHDLEDAAQHIQLQVLQSGNANEHESEMNNNKIRKQSIALLIDLPEHSQTYSVQSMCQHAHPRSNEYRGRRPQPNVSIISQLQLATLGCQTNCTGMECQSQDRCVCRWHQQEAEKEGSLPTSTLEADTAGVEENQSRSSARLCDGDSNMANTILVADGVEAQQDGTSSLQLEEEFLSNRMADIWRYQEKEWMDEATSKFLVQAIRKSTNDAYNRYWKNCAN